VVPKTWAQAELGAPAPHLLPQGVAVLPGCTALLRAAFFSGENELSIE
jgi:hypothetical protein